MNTTPFDDMLKRLDEKLSEAGYDDDGEIEVSVVEIDGTEYSELMQLQLDGNTYVYLSDLDNPDNFIIHKLVIEDDEEYLIGLDSKEEFDKALLHFSKTMLGE